MKALSSTLLGLLLLAGCDASTSEPAAHDLVVTFGDGSGPGGAALYGLVPGNEPTPLAELAGQDLYWPNCAGLGGPIVLQSNQSSVRGTFSIWVYEAGRLRPAPAFPDGPLGVDDELHGELGPQPWAPDGRRFVLSTVEWCTPAIGCREGDLSIVDLDQGSVTPLTTGSPLDAQAMWDPAGGRIVFSSSYDGGSALFTIRPDGTELREVTLLSDFSSFSLESWGPGLDEITVRTVDLQSSPASASFVGINVSTGVTRDIPIHTDPLHTFYLEWERSGHTYVSTVRTDSLSPSPEYDPVYNVEVYDVQTGKGEIVLSRPGKGGLIDGPVASWCAP